MSSLECGAAEVNESTSSAFLISFHHHAAGVGFSKPIASMGPPRRCRYLCQKAAKAARARLTPIRQIVKKVISPRQRRRSTQSVLAQTR
jgi:hypothetical protein